MRRFITTRLVTSMITGEVELHEGYWYDGPVEECKGASANENALETGQQDFATALSNDYSTQFANQNAILGSLTKSLDPIINAGVGQYGFSKAEDAAMRTQASAGTAAAYRNARQANGEAMAAAGGGDTFLSSGVRAQTEAGLAQSAAQTQANQELGITQAGYAQGRQNYQNAVAGEQGIASQYNPTGYASQVTSANNSAYAMEENNQKLDAAASPWPAVGGILGGVAGSFLGPIGASLGSKVGSAIGGAASGSSATTNDGEAYDNGF